ncbi:NADH-quinone oxidoreductase subunit NuoF [Tissierella sp. Yu-01]|uniref:NADH-quinone oxidoreductase subunit NuoF n=1 Tax=Tissierella sp. Yu-01 TaxID=3035694 RepID=UPI00240D93F6|nr:NADH-quinone oxidoreductase subunit NuoF [Tissierella sp. Yu-01]WFA09942.1 NADH-quinone oxidoreductase subunit NuoF [Tissierella sp. Yu-01]
MKVVVGLGSCGIAAGANKVFNLLKDEIEKKDLDIDLRIAGCVGSCHLEPIVDFYDEEGHLDRCVKVSPDNVLNLLEKALKKEFDEASIISKEDMEAQNRQVRIAIENCGYINPEEIDDYIATGGYDGLKKALKMTQEEVIEEVKIAGLRGRGGAGFPTWFKWNAAYKEKATPKYMVCNADEGDPGAFMDRSVLEGDPHRILEGMIIGGYAMGANEGIIYVRAEYPLAIKRLEIAIAQARNVGYLGKNILGLGFDFDIRIKAGAGAFVCGEETALIASLEGERGMPRLKPPFPAQKGFWNKPTNINNVETFANVPWIFKHGGEEYARLGSEKSKGTKVFALTGKIKKGGLVEVPMGMPLREIIYDIGGGLSGNKKFKAVQMGGPSGGCIPAELIDTPIDYESVSKVGAIMGSGGMVVIDESACMVEMAKFFLSFTRKESCGKCIHCRLGTKRMLEILERITEGKGKEGDIETLEQLARDVQAGSLCQLGITAPNPVLSMIKNFRSEFEAHINEKKCPAHVCKSLITYEIKDNCTGCTICARNCPVDAITGVLKGMHVIDKEICTKCGKCHDVCKFNAVEIN